MRSKIKNAMLSGLITTHAQNEKMEEQRMSNPAHTDYDFSAQKVIRITGFEKQQYSFIRVTEKLLREFKIKYDYIRTDFLFQDAEGFGLCMWFDIYDDMTETCFVGAVDKSEYYFAGTNELDAVNYVFREISLPGSNG